MRFKNLNIKSFQLFLFIFLYVIGNLEAQERAQGRIFVLGDSLSDSGALRAQVDPSKSFTYTDPSITSNTAGLGGKVWTEYIGADSATKYPAYTCSNGFNKSNHNFAVGGALITASSGDASSLCTTPSSLLDQINALPSSLKESDTVIIWIGANDIFKVASPAPGDVSISIDYVLGAYFADLDTLSQKCAICKVKIISVPHLGYTPEAQFIKKNVNKLNQLVDYFNAAVSNHINTKQVTANFNAQFFDINLFYDSLIRGQYKNQSGIKNGGFVNANSTYISYCSFDLGYSIDPQHICGVGSLSQPYLIFADLVHPSSHVHNEIYAIFKNAGLFTK